MPIMCFHLSLLHIHVLSFPYVEGELIKHNNFSKIVRLIIFTHNSKRRQVTVGKPEEQQYLRDPEADNC